MSMIEKKTLKGLLARDKNNTFGSDWIRWYPGAERKDISIDSSGYWTTGGIDYHPCNGIKDFRDRYPDYKGKIPRKGSWMEAEI